MKPTKSLDSIASSIGWDENEFDEQEDLDTEEEKKDRYLHADDNPAFELGKLRPVFLGYNTIRHRCKK